MTNSSQDNFNISKQRTKSLNVHNSDRVYTNVLTTRQEEENFIKVTKLNEEELESKMNKLASESKRFPKKDKNNYLVFHEKYPNDTLQEKVFKHGGFIKYYTTKKAPIHVINKLSKVTTAEIIYQYRDQFTEEEIYNVQLASMAMPTMIDLPVTFPYTNPYNVLFSLFDLVWCVNVVKLSFPRLRSLTKEQEKYYTYDESTKMYHAKTEYKYDFMEYIREDLGIWKMWIHTICDSELEREEMSKIIRQHSNRKKIFGMSRDDKKESDSVSDSGVNPDEE